MTTGEGTSAERPKDVRCEPPSNTRDLSSTWRQFAKTFVLIFPIYILGYMEFSFSWLLIALAVFFFWRRNVGSKSGRFSRALAFFELEETSVKPSLTTSRLPSWTVKQMWPYICQFVEKLFRETIEPAVKEANSHLSTFSFCKIDMGDKPLRVNGVKVYTENVDKRQIIMDLQVSFVGNTEIDVDIKRYYCKAGIKSVQLHGVLRVVLDPLLGHMPLVGALSLFFLKKPLLDINWTGLTNILDIPGLNGFSDSLIQDIIYSYLVLPNRITIPLVQDEELARIRFPMPKGVLRIHFLEAQDLEIKDTYLGGLIKGKSDPYGIIQLGNQLFQSKTIKENLHPKWNEVYEAMVYEAPGNHLEIELFDEDPDKDDFLGSLMIDTIELQKEQKVDEWFDLEEVTTGKLHLRLEWLSLLSTAQKLEKVLQSIRADKGQTKDGLSSALLAVFLDSAKNLPSVFEGSFGCGNSQGRRASGLVFCENTTSLYKTLFSYPIDFNSDGSKHAQKALKSGKKVSSDPNPYVVFMVGNKKQESKVRYKTNEPLWEEACSFLIHNPRDQHLEVEVRDEKHKCALGNLTVPLSILLQEENMTLTQQFPLTNSGPTCTLKLTMTLRVLCLEKQGASDQPSNVQVRRTGTVSPTTKCPRPSTSGDPQLSPQLNPTPSPRVSLTDQINGGSPMRGSLGEVRRSSSSLAISHIHRLQPHRESTGSLASDSSLPSASQDLQNRLAHLHNGCGLSRYPLGEVQLTVRHSSQRNKLIVVVHACRNLLPWPKDTLDPYVRLYLLPDKSRMGRRKTSVVKKVLNPVYDQTFEFSVANTELPRRSLDVAVKNSGSLLSKHKGLLGKAIVSLSSDEISKGWTQWYNLTEDGKPKADQA
ncbi:extended synaptotagmin-2 isoform X2 [Denticeps clupeoides]|uniref:extended synaptotagmin-2 isoform X2 n=1 Tax=Denticeps clupeoides TaxID=299321 RepID=UPI0010A457DD|nr:extended synaptotagmin-2 isoform X2 [Denticeps clupeoides]